MTARYWPYYCEENVWHTCAELGDEEALVLIISNQQRAVPLWFQRAAADGKGPVIWDYHVVLVVLDQGEWFVVDADTTLGPRVPASDYLEKTFMGVGALPPEARPLFRVMSAAKYRDTLSSDRRHMLKPDGSYGSPPPPWDPIGDQTKSNLLALIDVAQPRPGEVLDLEAVHAQLKGGE